MIQKAAFTREVLQFLATHAIGVFSTLDAQGDIQSRTVYYVTDEEGYLYILTKSGTAKVHEIATHKNVTFTAYDETTYQSIQMQGVGDVEGDANKKNQVYHAITNLRDKTGNNRLVPITLFHEGAFIVLRITPTNIKFSDFQQKLAAES